MIFHHSAMALSFAVAIALPGWARAAEEPPVVQLLLKQMERQSKVKPTYEDIETDADGTVTVTGLSFTMPVEGTAGTAAKLTVGSIELEEISDEGGGLWEIGSATYSGLKVDFPGAAGAAFAVSVPEMSIEDWYLKDAGDSPTPVEVVRASLTTARKASAGKITVSAAGQTFTADGFDVAWDGDPLTGSGKTTMKVSNIVIPETAVAAIDPTGQMKALGYGSLAFDLGGEGNVTLGADRLGFDVDVFYTGRDMGTLKVGAAAADIPAAVLAELQKSEPGKQPDFTALMPQLMTIQLNRLVVRFEDNSLTAKLLPLAAKMQGMDVETMIANTGALLQLGLAELKNPAFTAKAVAAVTTFLKDPKSLTVAARPAAPVAVQQLMALDPANPGVALDQLGITITAND